MPFVKVMIHAVWGTKSREHLLTKDVRPMVLKHILENAIKKEIHIDSLNGYTDHLHCLFGLNTDMTISKTMQLIKGESSFWINKENLTKTKFEWADEYFAVSVSESIVPKVRAYIENQEHHHAKKTFMEEYEEFMRTYKFESHG